MAALKSSVEFIIFVRLVKASPELECSAITRVEPSQLMSGTEWELLHIRVNHLQVPYVLKTCMRPIKP